MDCGARFVLREYAESWARSMRTAEKMNGTAGRELSAELRSDCAAHAGADSGALRREAGRERRYDDGASGSV
jgi:hypothetical protein